MRVPLVGALVTAGLLGSTAPALAVSPASAPSDSRAVGQAPSAFRVAGSGVADPGSASALIRALARGGLPVAVKAGPSVGVPEELRPYNPVQVDLPRVGYKEPLRVWTYEIERGIRVVDVYNVVDLQGSKIPGEYNPEPESVPADVMKRYVEDVRENLSRLKSSSPQGKRLVKAFGKAPLPEDSVRPKTPDGKIVDEVLFVSPVKEASGAPGVQKWGRPKSGPFNSRLAETPAVGSWSFLQYSPRDIYDFGVMNERSYFLLPWEVFAHEAIHASHALADTKARRAVEQIPPPTKGNVSDLAKGKIRTAHEEILTHGAPFDREYALTVDYARRLAKDPDLPGLEWRMIKNPDGAYGILLSLQEKDVARLHREAKDAYAEAEKSGKTGEELDRLRKRVERLAILDDLAGISEYQIVKDAGRETRPIYSMGQAQPKGWDVSVHRVREGVAPSSLQGKTLDEIKKAGAVSLVGEAGTACDGANMICALPEGPVEEVPDALRDKTAKDITERFKKDEPVLAKDYGLDSDKRPVVDPEKARAAAVEEGKKWSQRAKERAAQVCEGSGHASCLESADWGELRREARAGAEEVVNKKLAATEKVSEIKLTPDLKTALKDPSALYVPYPETRAKLGGDSLAWKGVKAAGGAGLYLAGIYGAFAGESTDLEKAAAVTAMLPAVGNLLQVGVDIQRKDFAGAGVDGFALLVEGLELFGVETGVGGPAAAAAAAAMAYHIGRMVIEEDLHSWTEVAGMPKARDDAWHDALLNYLQDPDKGWLAKEGSTQTVAAGIAFLQAVELQRASVKAAAHAATVAPGGGAYRDPKASDWARAKASEDADAKVDGLTGHTPKIIREALAKSLAKNMNDSWKEPKGQDFNNKFIDRAKGITVGKWCGRSMPDGSNPCWEGAQQVKKTSLDKLAQQPPGITAGEIEDLLENLGMTDPGFLEVDKPFQLVNDSGDGKQYLTADLDKHRAVRRKGANDPLRQDFLFRTTGRVSLLDGELCLAAGDKDGDPIAVVGCTHRNAPEQRWIPDASGHLRNAKTGRLLEAGAPDGDPTTVKDEGTPSKRATWARQEPKRDGVKQDTSEVLKKLFAAEGSTKKVDSFVPVPGAKDQYWAFSGANYTTVQVDKDTGDGRLQLTIPDWSGVRAVKDHWETLQRLTSASRDTRISAAMPVPGADRDLYVFSGDQYTRIRINDKRDDATVDAPQSLDKWGALKGLFAKSGVKRVDAVRPIPGHGDCFQVFSGSWSNQICLDEDLNGRETGPVQRNAERWPEVGARTGQDQIQSWIPVPGRQMAYYVLTDGQYTKVDRTVLDSPPDANLEIHATWTYFTFSWKNGKRLPEGAKIEISRNGVRTASGAYDASLGEIRPDDETRKSLLYNLPRDVVGAWDSTMRARFVYTHPDGSEEATGYWEKSYWCSFWECDFR